MTKNQTEEAPQAASSQDPLLVANRLTEALLVQKTEQVGERASNRHLRPKDRAEKTQ